MVRGRSEIHLRRTFRTLWDISSRPKRQHNWVGRFLRYLPLKSTNMDSKSKKYSTSSANSAAVVAQPEPEPIQVKEKESKWKNCCHPPTKKFWAKLAAIILAILVVLTVLKSIGVIAASILAAIETKYLSEEHSGKIAALIAVCVSAAVTVSVSIYALVAVFTKKIKPIHIASIVLVVLAITQLVILTSTLLVTDNDKVALDKELTDSFRKALEHNPRQTKIWSRTQYSLNCCGLYSPDDYRLLNMPPYFVPEVPISCCPGYDPDRSPLVQERERESCRAKKEYHKVGCLHLVEESLYKASVLEVHVVIGLIILEAITATAALVVATIRKRAKRENSDEEAN